MALPRNEFYRCFAAARRTEAAHPPLRRLSVVLLFVGVFHFVADTLAASANGTNANLAFANLNRALRVFEKGVVPPARADAPRPCVDPAADDHGPHADEPVI